MQDLQLIQHSDEESLFSGITRDLEEKGFTVQPAGLPKYVIDGLTTHLAQIEPEHFHRAQVGRNRDISQNQFVRRNKVFWIEGGQAEATSWLSWAELLRVYLNRCLFLGLTSFESHFTLYEKGDFYKRHLDKFKGRRNRVVSLVTYLNEGWLPDQGGELVLYPPQQSSIRVTPMLGTLAVFMSEEIPHEVLVTERNRFGVAGWFRMDEPGNTPMLR